MAQFENPFFGVLYISNSDPQFLLKSVLTMYSNNFILENYSAVQKLQKKYILVSTTEISLLMSRTYICFCNYSVGWASFDHLHHLGKYNST